MKVVLREDIDHLGDRGEIVTVAAGYARNYLLPKGLALAATPGNLQQIEHRQRAWAARDDKDVDAAEALASRIAELELSIVRKSGETGTLYGSVTNAELAGLLASHGIEVPRRSITIDEPIKSVGSYEVPVKLHRKVTGRIKLQVVAEEPAD